MIWCLLLQFICLIHVTVEIKIMIVTDVERNISSLCVDDFDTRVSCTADEEPIQLQSTCNDAYDRYELQSIQVKPFTWNYLQINSNKIKKWKKWYLGKTIYLYVYTSQENVTFEIYINNENKKFKAQKLNPFEWYDFVIESNSNETKLLNGTLHCLDTLPITDINRLRIISDKLVFWKYGRDNVTMFPELKAIAIKNFHKELVRFTPYNCCEHHYTLYRLLDDENVHLTKRGNWYLLPHHFGLYILESPIYNNSIISHPIQCPYTNYAIYTFEYHPERNISCMVHEKKITVKLTKSSKYTTDITTRIASSIKGKYICTKSGCYCKDGYQGVNCNSECEKYSWGRNCEKTCGNCLSMKDCDKINEKCEQCEEGFINSKCKDFVEIEFDAYSKNEKAAWIRWKIKNEINHEVFLNTDGNQRKVNIEENCDLWSDYTNYICSFVNLTKPNTNNIVKCEINIDNKTYAIKSLDVYAMEEPSRPPLNLRQQDKKIIWNHPLITNGQIREFIINVTVIKSGFLEKKSVLKLIQIDKEKREYGIQYNLVKAISEFNKNREEEVIQLAPATQYYITVRAINLNFGRESKPLVITTELPTPVTMNQIYECGKKFEITNLVRDSDIYLVKTVTSKEQIKSILPTPVQNAFKQENKKFSNYYHEIGLLTSTVGNQSTKITVECAKRKDDTYFTVVVINRFNEKETYLLINIVESTTSGIIICIVLLVLIVVGIGVGIYFKIWTRFNWNKRNRFTLFRNTSNYFDVKYLKSPQNLDDPTK